MDQDYQEWLYESVLAQIKSDVASGDLTAIAELLQFIPETRLLGFIQAP